MGVDCRYGFCIQNAGVVLTAGIHVGYRCRCSYTKCRLLIGVDCRRRCVDSYSFGEGWLGWDGGGGRWGVSALL